MSRLATIEKIKELEERKEQIEESIKDLTVWFTGRKPVMRVYDNKFEVNKIRLEKFLETELYHLEGKIAVLIGELWYNKRARHSTSYNVMVEGDTPALSCAPP